MVAKELKLFYHNGKIYSGIMLMINSIITIKIIIICYIVIGPYSGARAICKSVKLMEPVRMMLRYYAVLF